MPAPALKITTTNDASPDNVDDIMFLYGWFPVGGGISGNFPTVRARVGENNPTFLECFLLIDITPCYAEQITFDELATVGTFIASAVPGSLSSLSFPALARVLGFLEINTCGNLSALNLSALTRCDNFLTITGNVSLTALDLSALTICGDSLSARANALTSLDVSGLLSIGGNFDAAENALPEAEIDAILGKLASLDGTAGTTIYENATIDLSGGSNAAPGAAGLAAKTVLEARGCTVTVNP